MSQTPERRMYLYYRRLKRSGRFRYDDFGQSPWLHIARRFRKPIREVREIVEAQREGNR